MELASKKIQQINKAPVLLLVEDNATDAKLLTKLFMENGFSGTFRWVSDGAQALDYLFRRGTFSEVALPELVLLDLNLPKVDGREVLVQLARHEETRRIPVIVLTTSSRKEDIKNCIEKGAASFFTKPSELHELRQLVERLKSVEFPRLGVGKT